MRSRFRVTPACLAQGSVSRPTRFLSRRSRREGSTGTACPPCTKPDVVDALKAQSAEEESRVELLERFVAEKDTRVAERDEQIAALRRRVRALADID